jgi:alpha-aminoadipate carrier protein LysW
LAQSGGRKRVLQIPASAVRLNLITKQGRGLSLLRSCISAVLQIAWEELTVPTGTCPECDADVHVDMDTDKGEIVSCEECGTELEIVGLDPVELDIVEEEDFDEDEDEDEY